MPKIPGLDISKVKDESGAPLPSPEMGGDPTVAQTIQDVKDKAEGVRLNKDGSPRKQRVRKGLPDSGASGTPSSLGQPGFTEAQIKASFQGLFSVAALATNYTGWFLSDAEADCFVPSSTLALNQLFPSVAQSKWGALSLASLSFGAVFIAKTLLYVEYKNSLAKRATAEVLKPEPVA